ncbi:uncharacterized protein LOC110978266 isoform X2 [Acanthaster planci]|uniref:Uncharacterized protein LOC110978266 isoform X2 n=1 Tax=Acanthaster planci TaxID=133434 RepID=A0A8B7Y8C9_ACAPL|nr:uncharacterized protein LOC110978266 isoform X2 [Acanthaster planci]
MDVPQWVKTFICLAVVVVSASATQSEEIEDNKISIRFDKVNLKQWNENENDPTNKFQLIVARSVSDYCSGSDCSLGENGSSTTPFTVSDIMILEGYPTDENADVQIVFYVSIANQQKSESGNQFALKKSILEVILKAHLMDIANATSYSVVFIGDERVGAPLDGTLNTIIIPIAIATLVLLILITLCLHFNEKRQEKQRKGLTTIKRGDIPSNDAHSEGIVLTSVNKNSVVPSGPKRTQALAEVGEPAIV